MSQLAQLYIVALTLLLKNLCWLWISFGVKAKVLNKAWKVPELALGCFFSVWSILFQMSPWFTLAQWSSLGNYFSLSLFFYLTLFFSIMTTWYLFSWLHLLRCKLNRILYFSILAAWNKVCYMVGAQGLLGVEINDLPILTTLRGSLGTFFFFECEDSESWAVHKESIRLTPKVLAPSTPPHCLPQPGEGHLVHKVSQSMKWSAAGIDWTCTQSS